MFRARTTLQIVTLISLQTLLLISGSTAGARGNSDGGGGIHMKPLEPFKYHCTAKLRDIVQPWYMDFQTEFSFTNDAEIAPLRKINVRFLPENWVLTEFNREGAQQPENLKGHSLLIDFSKVSRGTVDVAMSLHIATPSSEKEDRFDTKANSSHELGAKKLEVGGSVCHNKASVARVAPLCVEISVVCNREEI